MNDNNNRCRCRWRLEILFYPSVSVWSTTTSTAKYARAGMLLWKFSHESIHRFAIAFSLTFSIVINNKVCIMDINLIDGGSDNYIKLDISLNCWRLPIKHLLIGSANMFMCIFLSYLIVRFLECCVNCYSRESRKLQNRVMNHRQKHTYSHPVIYGYGKV